MSLFARNTALDISYKGDLLCTVSYPRGAKLLGQFSVCLRCLTQETRNLCVIPVLDKSNVCFLNWSWHFPFLNEQLHFLTGTVVWRLKRATTDKAETNTLVTSCNESFSWSHSAVSCEICSFQPSTAVFCSCVETRKKSSWTIKYVWIVNADMMKPQQKIRAQILSLAWERWIAWITQWTNQNIDWLRSPFSLRARSI